MISSSIHGLTTTLLSSEQVQDADGLSNANSSGDSIDSNKQLSNHSTNQTPQILRPLLIKKQLVEILSEMKHQTQLLEQLIVLQGKTIDDQRVAQSTVAFAKVKDDDAINHQ